MGKRVWIDKFLELFFKLQKSTFSSYRKGNNDLYLIQMAQGKLKVKSKVPDSVAKKKKQQNSVKNSKVTKKGGKSQKTPKAEAAKLTAKFQKGLGKKINANIESELASRCQRVEEGKSFSILGSELGHKNK